MLESVIAKEILWRKAEMGNLHLLSKSIITEQGAMSFRRSAYCLIYAHWEGAVKQMAQAYASSVRKSGLRFDEIHSCFRAMIARNAFERSANSKKISPYIESLNIYEQNTLNYVFFDFDSYVRSEGNLTSNVLKEIHCCLGIDYSNYFLLKEKFIDTQLVKRRNSIAHGENFPIERDVLDLAFNDAPDMFTKFSETLIESFRDRRFAI